MGRALPVSVNPQLVAQLSEAGAGDVDAPIWVVFAYVVSSCSVRKLQCWCPPGIAMVMIHYDAVTGYFSRHGWSLLNTSYVWNVQILTNVGVQGCGSDNGCRDSHHSPGFEGRYAFSSSGTLQLCSSPAHIEQAWEYKRILYED